MSLERRISDERRLKAKTAKQIGLILRDKSKLTAKEIGKQYAIHNNGCSCYLCGNPRKHFQEKTLKEKSEDQTWDNDFLDYDPYDYY